jgi:hypothetical protein
MPGESKAIELVKIPKEADYEDYLSAYLQAGGLYVERKTILREEGEDLLELDLITTNFQKDASEKLLIEIKSGNWGAPDVFKIKGWLIFLNYKNGCLITQKYKPNFDNLKSIAKALNIELIDNSDLDRTEDILSHLLLLKPDQAEIESIRFSYLLERKILCELKNYKKESIRKSDKLKGYFELDDYFFKINSSSFFSRNPIQRITQLFDYYTKHKNITAKICNEINGGDFDDSTLKLSPKCYRETFYKPQFGVLQIALYVEHISRLTILKCAIEYLINKYNGAYSFFDTSLSYLPSSLLNGLKSIASDKYLFLYPRFWQFFTYVFGGFILTDFKEKEFELLSSNTGIPIDEIPNAFDSFNKLFPREDGWLLKFPNSSVEWHYFFPIAFSGIGVNYRRIKYSEDESYENLFSQLSQDKTVKDLTKWAKLSYDILNGS